MARKMAKKVKQDMAEFDRKFKAFEYFEKHGDGKILLLILHAYMIGKYFHGFPPNFKIT